MRPAGEALVEDIEKLAIDIILQLQLRLGIVIGIDVCRG